MSRKKVEKQLVALLRQHSGVQDIPEAATDLFADLQLSGEETRAFLDAFAQEFNVDMSTFLAYFHDPSAEISSAQQVVPYMRNGQVAPYQPIAFVHLADAAQSGVWHWDYPDHSLKKTGWRDLVQYSLILAVAFWIVASIFI